MKKRACILIALALCLLFGSSCASTWKTFDKFEKYYYDNESLLNSVAEAIWSYENFRVYFSQGYKGEIVLKPSEISLPDELAQGIHKLFSDAMIDIRKEDGKIRFSFHAKKDRYALIYHPDGAGDIIHTSLLTINENWSLIFILND